MKNETPSPMGMMKCKRDRATEGRLLCQDEVKQHKHFLSFFLLDSVMMLLQSDN